MEDSIKNARAAIFDFDGTLWNIELSWQDLYERLTDAGRLYGHVGEFGSIIDAYLWADKMYGARKKMIEVQDEFEQEGLPGTPVKAGRAAAKWRLKRCLATGILSLNTSSTIERVVGGWGVYPIISIDKVRKPKPDPEGLLKALDVLKCSPGEAVFIGNSDTDRKCARAASVAYVDVTEIREAWFL
ncbi:MAG: HAD hydrolase-like protein [Thermoplasmatota archaeon]